MGIWIRNPGYSHGQNHPLQRVSGTHITLWGALRALPPGVSDPSRDFYSFSAALSGLNFHMFSSVCGAGPDLLRFIIRVCSTTAVDRAG